MKISGIYKIINTITGDFYIGSSKNIKRRWTDHKKPSSLKNNPNNQLYQDMQKFGLDKFVFEVLEEVEPEQLKEKEQQFIEKLQPTYNNYNAKGLNIERRKEHNEEYRKTDKCKKAKKQYNNQLCCYNGETLTLDALSKRFKRKGISNPTQEAKKYLLVKSKIIEKQQQ